jgi:hypothetical protein
VRVRVARSQVEASLANPLDPASIRFAGAVRGAASFDLEGVARYDSGGVLAAAETAASAANPLYADAAAFVARVAGRESQLGLRGAAFVPGIDVTSTGDLRLASSWNVAEWRFAGRAPVLTLRAAGHVHVDANLSDGFAAAAGDASAFVLPDTPARSSSYRLVAGADLAAPDPLAVQRAVDADLVVAPGVPFDGFNPAAPVMVRTGTGSIDIVAARDVVLGNQASVVYTAGVRGSGLPLPDPIPVGGLDGLPYPEASGDLRVVAGRDLVGAASTQLFTDWLLRTGSRDGDPGAGPTAWTVAFDRFEQGFGVFGGGQLLLTAGRDVLDVSAVLPSVGQPTASSVLGGSSLRETGGGRLEVRAARDLQGGTYLAGRGSARLVAGGAIRSRAADDPFAFAPVLALGDTTFEVTARDDLRIETAVNPTLLGQSLLTQPFFTWFSTYTDRARLDLLSIGGNVSVGADVSVSSPLASAYPLIFFADDGAAKILPPTLAAYSAGGDVRVEGSFTLWPSAAGNLRLGARQDVVFDGRSTIVDVVLSDVDANRDLPTAARPSTTFAGFELLLSGFSDAAAFHAATPVHAPRDGAATVADPVRITALAGDIDFAPTASNSGELLFLAKPARLVAGRDIRGLGLRAQNVAPGDVTTLSAGRDIVYPRARDSTGRLLANIREISVGGPGELQLIAGRDLDLQISRGVTSQGNVVNPALGTIGADVSIVTGESGGRPDFDAFIERYLAGSELYRADLLAYVRTRVDAGVSDAAAARTQFRALPRDRQRPLLEKVLMAELRAGGRAAAQPGPGGGDFARAFAALETYYPGSNPDLENGATLPYRGDARLFFSRVYTLRGGDVRFITPGGGVNVGLATPPTAFGVRKPASELGVVVQSVGDVEIAMYDDLAVNESRVFAADGGNILVWSTRGDIDAGRGAKTAISAPPPVITVDSSGQPQITFPAAFSGSGIQTIATTAGRDPGDVDLFAPRGVVNAGDAGIVAGNLTIAATAVIGAGNISVSGTAVGVPVDTGGLGASLAGASNAAAGTASAAQDVVGDAGGKTAETPLAEAALNWLDVFVVGLGEEGCRPDDLECLKRQNARGDAP